MKERDEENIVRDTPQSDLNALFKFSIGYLFLSWWSVCECVCVDGCKAVQLGAWSIFFAHKERARWGACERARALTLMGVRGRLIR